RVDVQIDKKIHRTEFKIDNTWDAAVLVERLPELRLYGISLVVELAEASSDSAQLRVSSTMTLKYEGEWSTAGLHVADVSTLRDPLRRLVNWITRQGEVSLAEITAYSGESENTARQMIDELIEMGFVQPLERMGDPRYRIHLAGRHRRQVPFDIWQSL